MGKGTGVSWAHNTDNYVIGCDRYSPECDNCYAIGEAARQERFGLERYTGLTQLRTIGGAPFLDWTGDVRVVPKVLDEVRRRTRPASGEPYRNFWCSMGDLFHRDVPHSALELALQTWLKVDWQIHMLLTKRTFEMAWFFHQLHFDDAETSLPAHIWPGTTIGTQKRVDHLSALGAIPSHARWISAEPLLERINLRPYLSRRAPDGKPWVSMVVIGGESSACGRSARPMNLEWVEDLMAQCSDAGVAIWFKQVGEVLARSMSLTSRHGSDLSELPSWLRVQELPDNPAVCALHGYQPRPLEVNRGR